MILVVFFQRPVKKGRSNSFSWGESANFKLPSFVFNIVSGRTLLGALQQRVTKSWLMVLGFCPAGFTSKVDFTSGMNW